MKNIILKILGTLALMAVVLGSVPGFDGELTPTPDPDNGIVIEEGDEGEEDDGVSTCKIGDDDEDKDRKPFG